MNRASSWLPGPFALILLGGGALASASPSTSSPPVIDQRPGSYWQARVSGGPPKDGIPSIDEPGFISADEADRGLDANDKIVGIVENGQAKAYPQNILVYHEIVNDTVGGRNVAVTYCPLTGTALGFDRDETGFGVSGRLVNSNLIMYDRATDTYWPQMAAIGINGPMLGEGLDEVRVFWTEWSKWQSRHPQTEVLSTRTGYARNYNRDPYGGYNPRQEYYAEGSDPIFGVMNSSDRYPAKREIFGFRTQSEAVAVDMQHLRDQKQLSFSGSAHDYTIVYDAGLDTARVLRLEEGQSMNAIMNADIQFTREGIQGELGELTEVNGFEAFWFAWYAFYPRTHVID